MAEKLDLQEVLADCYATLGILRVLPFDEATTALEQAVVIAEKNGYTAIEARARLNLGTHYVYSGKCFCRPRTVFPDCRSDRSHPG